MPAASSSTPCCRAAARIPPDKLRFSIYEAQGRSHGERALIIPDVSPNTRRAPEFRHLPGRLDTTATVNAVIRSDIRVEAGKLTEATVEHQAAELTMKLVREPGGEAIADTSWSIAHEFRRSGARKSSAPTPRWCWPKANTPSSPRTATASTSAISRSSRRAEPGGRGARHRGDVADQADEGAD